MGARNTRKAERRTKWFEAKNQLKVAKEKRAKRKEAHEELMAKQLADKEMRWPSKVTIENMESNGL